MEPLPILDIIYEFFTSPMWNDTIKDFIIANCYIFTGDDEFSHEHQKCHVEFCTIIENTLNIYLFELLGIDFDVFEKACVAASKYPDSIGSKVLSVLKQATDFRYFAAKMYAYNVMLDREVSYRIQVHGDDSKAFFTECETMDTAAQIATAELNKVEAELGLPPTVPVIDYEVTRSVSIPESKSDKVIEVVSAPKVKAEEPMVVPKVEPKIEQVKPVQEEEKPVIPSLKNLNISDSEREQLKLKLKREKMSQTVDEEEIKRRKEMFQKRKEQLTNEKREILQEKIQFDIKKKPAKIIVKEEDTSDALVKALAKRVKTIIQTE